MKSFNKVMLATILGLGIFGVANADTAEKIGVVNIDKIVAAHPSKDVLVNIEKEVQALNEGFEKKTQEVMAKKTALEKELPKLAKKDAENKKAAFNKMLAALDVEQQQAQKKHGELMQKYNEQQEKLFNNISDTIKEYGKANGYTVLLNDKIVLFANAKDITDEITKTLKPLAK